MKPVTIIVALFLVTASIVHLLTIIFQVNIVANGVNIPVWLSILGCIVPAGLAFMLWRENRKHGLQRMSLRKKKC